MAVREQVPRHDHFGPAVPVLTGILPALAWLAFGIFTSLATAWIVGGGPRGLGYAAVYLLATAPGLPLGFALFGRGHAAGWLSGAALGYGLTALALWVPVAAGVPSGVTFLLAWATVTAATWIVIPRDAPLVALPAWSRRDSSALAAVLLLVPLLFVFPYRNLGAADARGTRYYRAYFTADYLWHVALTSELAKFATPPANPYLASEPVHYYWTYFILPAAVAGAGPRPLADVELALKINAFCSGFLFAGLIALATWCAVPRAGPMAAAVALTIVAASAEGAYALYDLWTRGRPLSAVADMNIDAITAWHFNGLRIDGLARSMWYTPQHSMSCALGLIAIPIAGYAGAAASVGAVALAGLALALSTTFNPLLGGVFSLIYGGVILADAVRSRRLATLPRHAIAAGPVALAIAWSLANEMLEGAGGALVIGIGGLARNAPITTLMLSLGVLIVPAVAGLWPLRGLGRPFWPALASVGAGLVLFYAVRLSVDLSYIGFRAGQLLQIGLPALAARAFDRGLQRGRQWAIAGVAALLFVVGLPTTAIDTYNAQDIGNLRMGPGFRWTITVTPAEQAAFEWIRTHTPSTAVVQMDAFAHGRETWTFIPSFAERRMAAGLPISLLNTPEYERRSQRVRDIYATGDAEAAWVAARRLRINYLYVGRAERASIPAASLEKFERHPEFFRRVFVNEEVRLYAMVRSAS